MDTSEALEEAETVGSPEGETLTSPAEIGVQLEQQ